MKVLNSRKLQVAQNKSNIFWLYSRRLFRTKLTFMFPVIKKLFFFIFFVLGIPFVVFTQVVAPDADKIVFTDTIAGHVDPIFIFCSSTFAGDDTLGVLISQTPGGVLAQIEWSRLNDTDYVYDAPFLVENGIASSTAVDLSSGGYRVRMFDGGSLDTLFYAWVFVNKPYVRAQIQNFTCEYLALNGEASSAPFYYTDLTDSSRQYLKNGIEFEWTADPKAEIPYPTLDLNPITYSPPYEDTRYTLTVTDSLGCTDLDTLFYHSINVKAEMDPLPISGEAPLEVEFVNNAKNAVTYSWDFGDEQTSTMETPDPHSYFVPGEYEITFVARSEEKCVDTLVYQYITVDPSELSVPNVFTPNGDGYNDYFYVSAKSLRSLSMKILTRNGRKIYEFSGQGDQLRDWKGWDGKIGGKTFASPGIYYYIIKALGWDDIKYEGKLYRGTVYLLREK